MKKTSINPRVYAALYLQKKTASEKVDQANYIVGKMTGNGSFLTPNPALVAVSAATADLSLAIANALSGRVEDKLDLLAKETAHDNIMICLKEYAENVANLSTDTVSAATILASGGFTITKTREKSPLPHAVTDIVAEFTGEAGKILVQWKYASYAQRYELFMTTTPDTESSWVFVGSSTRRKFMVTSLASNTRYYFRMVSVGTAGSSAPSIVVSQITTMA